MSKSTDEEEVNEKGTLIISLEGEQIQSRCRLKYWDARWRFYTGYMKSGNAPPQHYELIAMSFWTF